MMANQEFGNSQESAKELGARQEAGKGTQERQPNDRNEAPQRIEQRGRDAYRETQALASTFDQVANEFGQFLREQTERRPYVSLATATGIGYVLGGGVPSRLTGFLFGLGSRFAVGMFLREQIGGSTADHDAAESRRSAS
jgi:ElaB/YqjD/DUF883 family membrane-anchored ribosome-binding protein